MKMNVIINIIKRTAVRGSLDPSQVPPGRDIQARRESRRRAVGAGHTMWVGGALLALVLAGGLMAGMSCSGGDGEPNFDRRAMLIDLTDKVMLPAYARFADATVALEQAATAFCAAPDTATLDALQAAWQAAREPWKWADAFAFGPYMEVSLGRFGPRLDFWPARTDEIDARLGGSEAVDAAALASAGVTVRGLPVIEYLLFDPVGSDAAVLAAFTAAGSGDRRCDYLQGLSTDVSTSARALLAAWQPSGGNYRAELVDAGQGSQSFSTLQSAVSEVVNQMYFATDELQRMKIGKALGKRDGGVPQPDTVESRFGDHSLADALATLAGIEALYTGTLPGGEVGLGIAAYLQTRRPELDPAVRDSIAAARAAIQAISVPLRVAVVQTPAEVENAYDAVKALRDLIRVEVASALSISIILNDLDAD